MYSRNYYEENEDSRRPPDNYNGTSFGGIEENTASEVKEEREAAKEVFSHIPEKEKAGGFFSFLPKNIPLPAFLSKMGISSLSMPKIGTEEIILIAVAAYLFFSKEGDRECAIMLILLLFVS